VDAPAAEAPGGAARHDVGAAAAHPLVARAHRGELVVDPRLALVDLESSPANDPGPCVELSRARRIRWVANQQSKNPDVAACVQPCDTDPTQSSVAQNSAAYLELGGALPVAVIADDEDLLQSLRFDVRPADPRSTGCWAPAPSPRRASSSTTCPARRARSSPAS